MNKPNIRKPGVFDRRQAMFLGLGAASLAVSACHIPQAIGATARKQKTFVLVHGAWHGGWCWRDVRSLLEAQGHRVLTPTLTGLGERAHLMSAAITLQTHIDDVLAVIRNEELESFTLVGHSYGGMVITGVADRIGTKISHLIYLDAALPKDGQSMATQGPPRSADAQSKADAFIRDLSADGIAMAAPPPELFGVPANRIELSNWLERRLTPHPMRTWFDPIALENGAPNVSRKTYVLCNAPTLDGTSFPWHAERLSKVSGWHLVTLATGHDAMLISPRAVADLLV